MPISAYFFKTIAIAFKNNVFVELNAVIHQYNAFRKVI